MPCATSRNGSITEITLQGARQFVRLAAREERITMPINIPSCVSIVPIFRELPPLALAELGKAMVHRKYGKGEIIHVAGDPVSELLVVASGQLRIVHTHPSGREQVVRLIEPGELIGELGLLTPAYYEGELVASVNSEACILPREAVQKVMRNYPDAALLLIEALAQRLATAEQIIGDLGLRDVGQRLAAELCRMAPYGRQLSEKQVEIEISSSWSDLASKLAATPESLSRRLKSFADAGVIQRAEGARTLVILDLDELKTIAGV